MAKELPNSYPCSVRVFKLRCGRRPASPLNALGIVWRVQQQLFGCKPVPAYAKIQHDKAGEAAGRRPQPSKVSRSHRKLRHSGEVTMQKQVSVIQIGPISAG